jgi:hypothetical protein
MTEASSLTGHLLLRLPHIYDVFWKGGKDFFIFGTGSCVETKVISFVRHNLQ